MSEMGTPLYDVSFITYNNPRPDRLGTAEKVMGRMRVWATNADKAIAIARQIAEKKRIEYLETVGAEPVQGVILEMILNDPLNNYGLIDEEDVPSEPVTGPQIELVTS